MAFIALTIAGGLTAACASGDSGNAEPDTTVAAKSGVSTASAAAVPDRKPPKMKLRIVNNIRQADLANYLSGGDLNEYEEPVDFDADYANKHANVRSRPSDDANGNADPNNPVDVHAIPVRGNYLLKMSDLDDGFPRLIARFKNAGSRTEHGLKLPPDNKPAYWFVQRDGPNEYRSYIIRWNGQQLVKLSYKVCDTSHPDGYPKDAAVADFKASCRGAADEQVGIFQVGDPPWTPCPQGCCIGGNVQLPGTGKPCTGKDCPKP